LFYTVVRRQTRRKWIESLICSAIEPLNRDGCVGKAGIDKKFTLEQVAPLTYEVGANIIVKSGKNAKWYLKWCNHQTLIEESVQK
jgi:hypothetical protein